MGFNSLVKALQPKNKIFYTLFENVALNLTDMGEKFKAAMKESDIQTRNRILKHLEDGEHKNDDLTHQVFVELGQNFITPFDREDIHQLVISLDDVADFIWASSKKIILYQVAETDDYMRNMSVVVEEAIQYLSKAVFALRNMRKLREITEACVQINSLENKADDLLDEGISRLFSETTDPIALLKLKEIYEDMEIVTDKCEDAADVIESIIIKYA